MEQHPVTSQSVTIASGASESGAFDLQGRSLIGVLFPAGWDAAGLALEVSIDGTNYKPVYTGTAELALCNTTAAAANHFAFFSDFGGVPLAFPIGTNLKLVSGTNASKVNQTADRVLTVYSRHVS